MEAHLTTAEVYETASLIGKDMEQIMGTYGHDVVVDIMPKIIQVLEQLEIAVGEREKGCLEMEEMRLQNERLMSEIKKEASQRRRLDEEFFQYKQSTSREISELNKLLEKLKDDNQCLIAEERVQAEEKKEVSHHLSSADLAVLTQMKSTIDSQRDVIRSKNGELQNAKEDLEAMEEQVDRLANINETLRRNLTLQKSRNSTLVQEKADLEADNKVLQQQLCRSAHDTDVVTVADTVDSGIEKTVVNQEQGSLAGTPSRNDPDRPRFTRKEMQRVLQEKNDLKEKVIALQEDLAYYGKKWPEDNNDTSLDTNPPSRENDSQKPRKSGISSFFKFFRKDENKTPGKKNEDFVIIDKT